MKINLLSINFEKKDEYDSAVSEEEESNLKEKEIKRKFGKNSVGEDSFSEENDNYNKGNLRKKKNIDIQLKLLNRKRKRVNSLNMKKNCHNGFERKIDCKKMLNEQILNSNTLSELNYFYNKLDKLISKFSFPDVISIILKLINGIPQDSRDNNELFQKIDSINKKVDNKNNLILICLSILSKSSLNSNKNKVKKKEKRNKTFEKKSKIINDNKNKERRKTIENGGNAIKKEISKSNKIEFIKGFRSDVKKLIFENHYYNCGNEIYGFRPKTKRYSNTITCYCLERENIKCTAKCRVRVNSNKVHLIGEHNHESGISTIYFYKTYYFLKDKEWTHIQVIKEADKKKVFLQS